jgi:hypothetical protein
MGDEELPLSADEWLREGQPGSETRQLFWADTQHAFPPRFEAVRSQRHGARRA